MDQSRRLATLLAVGGILTIATIALLLPGGSFLNQSALDETDTTTPERGEDEHAPVQEAEIDIDPQFSERENETLPIDVYADVWGYSEFTYEDVQLCVYGKDGQVLDQHSLGSIESPKDGKFTESYRLITQTSEQPKYIVVDHPRLRIDSRFRIDLLYWDAGEPDVTHDSLAEIQDEFEWPRTNEVGKCG